MSFRQWVSQINQPTIDLAESPDQRFRRIALIRMGLLLFPIVLMMATLRHMISPLPKANLFSTAFMLVSLFLTVIFARKVKSIFWSALALILGLAVIVIVGGWFNGGTRAPLVWAGLLFPCMGYCFGGKSLGRFGLLLGIGVYASLALGEGLGYISPTQLGQRFYLYSSQIAVGILLFSYSIGWTFGKSRALTQEQVIETSRLASMAHMAGGIAHEINNPLAIISASAQQIERMVSSPSLDIERVNSSTARILVAVHRISAVIGAMRTYASITGDAPSEGVDVVSALRQAVDLFSEEARLKNIVLALSVPDFKVHTFASQADLHHLFWQVLRNAMDAVINFDGTRNITASVENLNNKIEIRISNSGPAISKDVSSQMFIPFFTTKHEKSHQGLGLNIASGILKKIGGDMTLDTKSPETSFIIQLTCFKQEAP